MHNATQIPILTYLLTYLLTYVLTYLIIYVLNYLFNYLLTHLLAYYWPAYTWSRGQTSNGHWRLSSSSVTLHGRPAGGFTRSGQAMTSCRFQSNYSSTVTLHGGPVVLRPVGATLCCTGFGLRCTVYLSLPLRHSYSVRHLGLVGSHGRNPSVSASGVFDILALYKLDYYYYYYYYYYNYYYCSVPVRCRLR